MNKGMFVVVTLAGLFGVASADDAKKAPEKMPDMTPPADLVKMGKDMAGTWKCTGNAAGMDGKMAAMTATMTSKAEMGGWWIHDSFDAKMGTMPFHFDAFTTFDPASKKYHRMMMEMGGGWSTGDAAAPSGGKIDFELASHGSMGDSMFKDHVDTSDAKAGMKAKGEMSMDKGKTWQPVYDMTCKK
jgi:hypothetical protein